ncbi:hypothetical protein SAMN04487819_11690 [Actinopolyspora alba]|uniref:Uncharacterized protein n=1 Tax=Actinopolyspora alba TaxID=673379 RepID=A0A1I2BGE5_9ACTN|nr:hypothetical protein [Actinopolyspora alba]SFE55196.1 hypothetical protein SAMN04487819_11690 [Actinopolyspora alba]
MLKTYSERVLGWLVRVALLWCGVTATTAMLVGAHDELVVALLLAVFLGMTLLAERLDHLLRTRPEPGPCLEYLDGFDDTVLACALRDGHRGGHESRDGTRWARLRQGEHR